MLRNLFFGILIFLTACQNQDQNNDKNKSFSPDVIYGEDNRRDFYEIEDSSWQDIARSTVALIDMKKVIDQGTHYSIKATGFGRTYGLCPEENFYDQPIASFCSGSLIGPDIILTAGHCMRNKYNCEAARIVFNYNYQSENHDPTIISKDDVFLCKEIIHTERDKETGIDFALIRLDKKVTQYQPLPIQKDSLINLKEELVIIGHPSGLPSKWADKAQVIKNQEQFYFTTNLDSYGGNSGSAVFNSQTQEIEGLLVRGESDFVHDSQRNCRYSKVCPQDTENCRGEDVVRVSLVMDHISEDELQPLPSFLPRALWALPIVY